ncbi:MAG: MFS transporter [Rhodospirillaceae bacterium]|nr:MFS transporter [Rhodospirillaceae bacterium]
MNGGWTHPDRAGTTRRNMKRSLPDFSGLRQVFAIRNFALYTAGNTLSLTGMWVQRLAVGWLMWELTESGAWLGAIAIAEFLPIIILTPLGGVVADRFDRLRVSMIAQGFACVQATALWLLTLTGHISPEMLVVLMSIGGITNAMNQAARVTLVVNMVPREVMSTAIAISSIIFNVARIIGPAIAGILIATTDIAWAFFVNAGSYAALIVAMAMIRMPRLEHRIPPSSSYFRDLVEGARFTFTHTGVAAIIALTAVNSLFARPLIDLLPGFAGEVFKGGPQGLAILTSAMGLGAICASIWLAQRGRLTGLTNIVFVGVMINGAAVSVFAMSTNIWTGALLLAVSGFTQACTGTGTQTLIQSSVTDRLRGRVMSVWLVIGRGGPALGAMVMGTAAEIFSFGPPLLTGALVTFFAAAYVMPRRTKVARMLERTSTD